MLVKQGLQRTLLHNRGIASFPVSRTGTARRKLSLTYRLICFVGATLTDLDLAIDAFVNHPVGTRGAHIAIPEKNRIWRFDDFEAVLVANQAARWD
jgi:hypothetical protein